MIELKGKVAERFEKEREKAEKSPKTDVSENVEIVRKIVSETKGGTGMTDWGYKQEWSVSFDLPVDEKMKEFIDKMDKEHKEVEDVFNARIKKLFEQYVELDEAASLGYDKFLALFRLGYELGWNDHRDATAVKWKSIENELKKIRGSV